MPPAAEVWNLSHWTAREVPVKASLLSPEQSLTLKDRRLGLKIPSFSWLSLSRYQLPSGSPPRVTSSEKKNDIFVTQEITRALGALCQVMLAVKNLPANAGDMRDVGQSLSQEDALEKGVATQSRQEPGESHGQSSLVDYSPWGCKELDKTE